ncbi:MAG TPA: LysE family translocator [Pseudomonas sp.]|uniref:LysE family translocator n=1 Tax=Pseudomonas sp. TaxID=306 RepID=UPI002B49C14B|nr:LysE family translocator [Pseudomonas sp.]HKS11656.1 LysE family translocator [Pseudomonas sp.]
MDFATLLLFVPACFVLNMAPGPNNLLSLNNAASHGFGASCVAGIGRLFAFAVMIGLASAGLAAVIVASEAIFNAIRWVGAAYLIYIAVQLWRSRPEEPDAKGEQTKANIVQLMRREFIVAAGNPKAILIFTAFLPQFVVHDRPVGMQFLCLGLVFLVLEWVAIALYGYAGLHLQRLLATPWARICFNRICGALLGVAGVALLVGRRS